MANITTKVAGLELRNPTILASGILGQTGESLSRIFHDGGAGAVVTKSIGLNSKEGHSNPCLIEERDGMINAMGLPNPGIEGFSAEMEKVVENGVPTIGSVFADNAEDFAAVAKRMEDFGAVAVELNLSCPHADPYGLEMGSDPNTIISVVKEVKNTVNIPVFAKISPMVPDIIGIAQAVEDAGGDGVVAINTIRAMKIEPEIGKPVLMNKVGGLSGPALKPIGVRCVFEISSQVNIPVIGVGGIRTGYDALEYLMAGASAVQIGSGIHDREIDIFSKVAKELEDFMDAKGYTRLEDLIGNAQRC